jgi:hypothetical protein
MTTPWYHAHLPHEITLDRDYYGRNQEILTWLTQHLGPGLQMAYITGDIPQDQAQWSMDLIFGHTFLRFKREEDLAQFTLTWI